MKRPGKNIEIKDDMKQALTRHGFGRLGHTGGELVYQKEINTDVRLSLHARYASRDDDEWENLFRLELHVDSLNVQAEITRLDSSPLNEEDIHRLLTFIIETTQQIARQLKAFPQAAGEAAATNGFDQWTPDGLYNDRMRGDDQINLEEKVAHMILSSRDQEGAVTEERAAELGRRIVNTLLHETRPDLFRDGEVELGRLLQIRQPNARTAIVEIDFEGEVRDDLALAENIIEALRHECLSGNGLSDQEAVDGYTRHLRVWINGDYTTREI